MNKSSESFIATIEKQGREIERLQRIVDHLDLSELSLGKIIDGKDEEIKVLRGRLTRCNTRLYELEALDKKLNPAPSEVKP